MGNDEAGGAGRPARGGTETINRPDRATRPRRERQAPPRPRPPADRRGPESPESTAPGSIAPERARPAAQEPRRRVPPQGFARPRGPAPSTAQAPKAPQALKAPPAPKAPQALKAPRPSPARAAGRMPFLLLVCGLLSGALVSALVISTTLAQGSFQISQLQQQDNALARQRQQLEAQVAAARSAVVIEQRAYQLGMRRVGLVRFLDLRDGRVKTDAGSGSVNAAKVPGLTP